MGCLEGNCQNGEGIYLWPNGNQYIGNWKDGKRSGQGSYYWTDGSEYIGQWENGQFVEW
jgi:1-phosphatidylinositol-4-phosphate 5-kinase